MPDADGFEDRSTETRQPPRDRLITTVLLLCAGLLAGVAYINNIAASGLFGGCGLQDRECDYPLGDLGYRLGAVGIPGIYAATVAVAVVMMIAGRRARWIPVVGMVLIAVLAGIRILLIAIAVG